MAKIVDAWPWCSPRKQADMRAISARGWARRYSPAAARWRRACQAATADASNQLLTNSMSAHRNNILCDHPKG